MKIDMNENLIFVGFTNGHQIDYAKDGEGAFYSDPSSGCIIPLYMLKTHEHRLETSKDIPYPEGCKLCNVARGCDGSC